MLLLITNVLQYSDVFCMTCRFCGSHDAAAGYQALISISR